MVDVKNIEKIYASLWRGEKEYKFSQLRAALKEHNVTDLGSLKLNLKSNREALLKISEKFLMDALNIGNGSVSQSVESDYPDIPLTYAWQFEGVDDSKDCFLYPMTPLTCDILSGQCCELPVSNKGCAQTFTSQKQEVTEPSLFPANEAVNHYEKVSIQSNRSKSTVSNKGFGEIKSIQVKSALPNLLIDNWLLAENYLKYSIERDDGDYTDLPMVINLVVASVFNRKQSKISRREAIKLLQQLCPFFNDIRRLENLPGIFRQDNEFYSVLCKYILSEARKQALTNPFEFPGFIRECTEVKSIIEARVNKIPRIKLINGWLHPLSEVKNNIPGAEGQSYCNVWQFASLIVGAATRRCPDADADSSSATRILVDFDVIDSENSVTLVQAKSNDAIYLQLVGSMKEAFEMDIEKQLNQLD